MSRVSKKHMHPLLGEVDSDGPVAGRDEPSEDVQAWQLRQIQRAEVAAKRMLVGDPMAPQKAKLTAQEPILHEQPPVVVSTPETPSLRRLMRQGLAAAVRRLADKIEQEK